MKHIINTLRISFFSILLAGAFVVAGIPTGGKMATVSALTTAECYEKYNAKGQGSGVTDKATLTQKEQKEYNKSNCPSSKGGTCTKNVGSSGFVINCKSVADKCSDQYQGKGQGTGVADGDKLSDKQYNAYKKSECASQKGGPCRENAGSSGFVISCSGAQSGESDDPSDEPKDGTTDIGNDYNTDDCATSPEGLESSNCEVIKMIVTITNILSGLAATVIVAMIIWGGIQYSTAGAEAAKVQAAKQKIVNALLALLLLVFGFSIIQWLVPGGLI